MEVPPDENDRPQLGWLDVFDSTIYPVQDALSFYLTAADFLVLSQVCKRLRHWVLGKVSNINSRLNDFFDDPVTFRSHMARCRALISGPFALDVLELAHRRVPYLDLSVPLKDDELLAYLEEEEGYKFPGDGDNTVFKLINPARPGLAIRISWTEGSTIQDTLTSASTTAHVNFITWNKAYSIFPRQTFVNHHCLPLKPLDNLFGSSLNELADQGWTTRDIVWPDFATAHTRQVSGLRRVGDASTWIVPLETDSVKASSMPDFVIEYAQFKVPGNDSSHGQQRGFTQNQFRPDYYLELQAEQVVSPALRHKYLVASTEWKLFLTSRLQRWIWLELYKLEPNKRPAQLANAPLFSSEVLDLGDFEVPESWDYADDQIPKWYQEWEWTQAKRGSRT